MGVQGFQGDPETRIVRGLDLDCHTCKDCSTLTNFIFTIFLFYFLEFFIENYHTSKAMTIVVSKELKSE